MAKPTKSIVTGFEQYCLICGNPNVERHHLLMGNKHRHLAEEDGLVVGLCPAHHNSSNMSVHMNKEMKALSQMLAQACWERKWIADHFDERDTTEETLKNARDAFFNRYGENYL